MSDSQLKVLVVDDDVDTCDLYALALRPAGFAVTCAYDGGSALAKLREDRFDAAVIDLSLDQVDGLTVARDARAALGDRTPYLIAVSGYGSKAHRDATREAGFDEHHLKPFGPDELVASLRGAIGRATGSGG